MNAVTLKSMDVFFSSGCAHNVYVTVNRGAGYYAGSPYMKCSERVVQRVRLHVEVY